MKNEKKLNLGKIDIMSLNATFGKETEDAPETEQDPVISPLSLITDPLGVTSSPLFC